MKKQQGFTLLEILIVVVIAVSVAAFALPAYKKMQDRTNFMAAQGVLIELGNGLMMLQEEVDFSFPTTAQRVMKNWQESSLDPKATSISSSNAKYFLFLRKYMSPMPISSAGVYKNYRFVICPENSSSASYCCNSNSNVVACMYDAGYAGRPTKGEYYGAVYYRDSRVERISKAT